VLAICAGEELAGVSEEGPEGAAENSSKK